MQLKASTYEQYLQLAASPYSPLQLKDEVKLISERFKAPGSIASRFAPVTYLLDYASGKYLFIEETCFNLLGYTAKYLLEAGHNEYIRKWHPEEFELLNNEIFADNYRFLKTLPPEEYSDFVFSYNCRMLNPNEEYVKILQRYSYIPGSSIGNPSGAIGIILDISHFKNDHSIVHTIEETIKHNGELMNKLVYKKVHPVYDINTTQLISKREIPVLKYMAEGLSSKQIAEKLYLSINTVNNHRKSMLRKLNCKSSAELLAYAIKHGLL